MLNLAQEDWDAVADRIERAEGPIAWVWMAVRERDAWHLLVLTVRGCRRIERRHIRYSNVMFDTEQLSPVDAARKFREATVTAEGGIVFEVRTRSLASVYWHTTEPSGLFLTRGDWPRYAARFSRDVQNVNIPDRSDPLSATGQPYYPNVMTAAAELLYGVQPAHLGNDLTGNVTVVLPDRRARIRDISFVSDAAVVHVERVFPESGLTVRTAWRDEPEDTQWRFSDAPLVRDEVSIGTGGIPAHMSIVVTDASGTVLDRREWDPNRQERPKDVPVSAEQLQRWIAEGEGATLECKENLSNESVRHSFAETVAAFANGGGGVILVGVTDDYRVVGYNPEFSVSDQVSGIIDSLVTEPPPVRVDPVTLEGLVVYVVRVDQSAPNDRPHMVRGRVYHRANARTRVAFPSEVRRMTRDDGPHIHPAVWG